jgi:hypothetical protein
MIAALGGDVFIAIVASSIASLILLAAGYAWGKYRERRHFGRNNRNSSEFGDGIQPRLTC